MHPIIKVMLVGGKADGLLVSVAGDATEVSVTPAQYGAPSGQPLSYRIVSQTIDDERNSLASSVTPIRIAIS